MSLGPEARYGDCYWVRIVDDTDRVHLIVDSTCPEGVVGHLPRHDDVRACIPFRLIEDNHLSVQLFYRGEQTSFEGLKDYLRYGFTHAFRVHRAVVETRQFFFNRHRLVRRDRMNVLKYILEETLRNPHQKHSSVAVMTLMDDFRSLLHPDSKQHGAYYALLLESLCASGDLKKESSGFEYTLLPSALVTLDKYEEEQARHLRTIRIARRMLWATVGLLTVNAVLILEPHSGAIAAHVVAAWRWLTNP